MFAMASPNGCSAIAPRFPARLSEVLPCPRPIVQSPSAKVLVRFFKVARVKFIVLLFSPKNRSIDAAKSQRFTQVLFFQLTEVSTKETGDPSVRINNPSALKPATSSALSRLPEILKPGTRAPNDSSGNLVAVSSRSTPVGLGSLSA